MEKTFIEKVLVFLSRVEIALGIIIGEGLKWKDQYESLTGKLADSLSFLKKPRRSSTIKVM